MRRGDIFYADLEIPYGLRPVVVLTRDAAIPHLTNVTIAVVTTTARGIETEVALKRGSGGLAEDSVVSCDNIVTLPKEYLIRRLGSLELDDINAVSEAVKVALDLW